MAGLLSGCLFWVTCLVGLLVAMGHRSSWLLWVICLVGLLVVVGHLFSWFVSCCGSLV